MLRRFGEPQVGPGLLGILYHYNGTWISLESDGLGRLCSQSCLILEMYQGLDPMALMDG